MLTNARWVSTQWAVYVCIHHSTTPFALNSSSLSALSSLMWCSGGFLCCFFIQGPPDTVVWILPYLCPQSSSTPYFQIRKWELTSAGNTRLKSSFKNSIGTLLKDKCTSLNRETEILQETLGAKEMLPVLSTLYRICMYCISLSLWKRWSRGSGQLSSISTYFLWALENIAPRVQLRPWHRLVGAIPTPSPPCPLSN